MEPTERHQLLVHWKIRYIFLISKRQFALRFFQILYLYDLYWYVLFYICTYIFIYFNSAVREKKFSLSDFFLASDQTEELMAVPYSHFSPAVVMIQKFVSTKSPSKTSGMVVMCTGNKISTPSPIRLSSTVTNKVS